ncbi:MAG: DUF1624 domain-containing protein [Aquificales bacterium]|nr:DUF1624 domain-containing protein [Aquificales bacterium]
MPKKTIWRSLSKKTTQKIDGMMAENGRPSTSRLFPLDALRGLIIILMALDHANHFVAQQHSSGEYWGGAFPSYDNALPFLTRFVTHLAAPGFFFLMGAGMTLFTFSARRQDWHRWAFLRHFWLRGLILIALQLLIVNRAWELSPSGWALDIYIGVLFALGATMIVGSFLLWLPANWLLVVSVGLVLGTAVFFPDPAQWTQPQTILARLLFIPGGDLSVWVNYPVIPWLGLVTFGMAFAHWLHDDTRQAYRRAWQLGLLFLLAFVSLRLLNDFGNLRPRDGDDWIAFLNVVKYPPSLTFILLTMGINLSLLSAFSYIGSKGERLLQPLLVYGRVPLFFYITHLFLYAALGNLLTPDGTSLLVMYGYWLLGLLILYPLCLGYGRFKQSRPANSIWRFF